MPVSNPHFAKIPLNHIGIFPQPIFRLKVAGSNGHDIIVMSGYSLQTVVSRLKITEADKTGGMFVTAIDSVHKSLLCYFYLITFE